MNGVYIPNLCRPGALFLTILFGELLAFLLTLMAFGDIHWWQVLWNASLTIQWILLSSAGLLCLLRTHLKQLSVTQVTYFSFGVIIFITFFVSIAAMAVRYQFNWQLMLFDPLSHSFLIRNITMSVMVAAAALRYFYIMHQWQLKVTSEADAQAQALQARIRPHFLFNSMNIIASLVPTQPKDAELAIENLCELFRASLNPQQTFVPLKQELELCQRYLQIEKMRLGDRLEIDINLTACPMNLNIPALSIQPLVENAVYHGIQPREEGGCVSLIGWQENGQQQIVIEVSNPLPEKHQHSSVGHGMAIANIKQRLAVLFGDQAKLEIHQTEDSHHAKLYIPLERKRLYS